MISPSQRPLPDNNTHNRQISMPRVGFEPTVSAGERPKTCSYVVLPNYYFKNCKENLVFSKQVIIAIHCRLIYPSRLICFCVTTGNLTRYNLLKCMPDYMVSHSKTVHFKVLMSFARCNFAWGPC